VFNSNISELITRRYSCRSFEDRLIEEQKNKALSDFLSNLTTPDFPSIRLRLLHKKEMKKENLFTTGTYGLIRGANTFIAGIIQLIRPMPWEDFGYLMEKAVLMATDMGINTCWIGGIFDRKTCARVLDIRKNEMVPAVIAMGYAAPRKTLRDRVTRWSSGGDRRKPPGQLFFSQNLEHPLKYDEIGDHKMCLENVRLAPSASNKQPWRIILASGSYHFYLNRDPVYSKLIPRVDLQRIDMGIAMFHFEQTAREAGLDFKTCHDNPDLKDLPARFEYIVSYLITD
jgi:nitroreductase